VSQSDERQDFRRSPRSVALRPCHRSGAALAAAVTTPASAQAADNTLDRVRAAKVLRIAVLPGELPYFNKDLASGSWSGMCLEMANDIAKLLDVKLEYIESTYGNSILDCNRARSTSALPQPDATAGAGGGFLRPVFHQSLWRHAQEGLEAKTWARHQQAQRQHRGRCRLRNETVARRFAPNATIKSLKSRDEVC